MRKFLIVFIAVFLIAILVWVSAPPAIIYLAKKQLQTVFQGSEVTIGSCRVNPAKQLNLLEIRIQNKPVYDFQIKEVRIEFGLGSLLNGLIQKVSLNDATLAITLAQDNIAEFLKYLKLGTKGALGLQSFELANVAVNVKAKDIKFNGTISSRADLSARTVDFIDGQIESLDFQGLSAADISLEAAQNNPDGTFAIGRVKYNKLTISGIKSRVKLSGRELLLDKIDARVFDGTVGGKFKAALDDTLGYGAALKLTSLDIARIVSDLELKEKFEMTGRLSGELIVEGRGAVMSQINGRLNSLESGGMLIIKDKKFLEDMVRGSGQSLDLLVENFTNYHYNIAALKLFLENRNLVLDTALEGETGKRNINIILHDFH